MFCDKCGTPLQSGQRFCSRCGKELAITSIAYPARGRVAEHVRLVGILWLGWAAFEMVSSAVVYILANTLFLRPGSQHWLHAFMSAVAVLLLVKATAGFASGWGLLQREPWGAAPNPGIGIRELVQRTLRDGFGRLHALGASACRVGTRI